MQPVHSAVPGRRPLSAEDLWAIPRVGSPIPRPDGRALAVAVTTPDVEANLQRGRLWLVDVAGEAPPRPLTAQEHSASNPQWSPDGRRLAFLRKIGPGGKPAAKPEEEKPQVYLLSLDGGEAERLTDLPLGVTDLRWLPDGSGLVLAAQVLSGHFPPEATRAELERRAKDPVKVHVTEERFFRYWDTWLTTGEVMHLWRLDVVNRSLVDLTPTEVHWFDWMEPTLQFDVAPDGKDVAYEGLWYDANRARVRSSVWVVPLQGGKPRNLTADFPAGAGRPRWTRDGKALIHGRTEDPDFYADRNRLYHWSRETGAHEVWLDTWDRSPVDWVPAPDGSLLLVAEERARQALLLAHRGQTPTALVPDGWVTGPQRLPDGRIVFSHQSLSAPAEVFVVDADGKNRRRLTRFTEAALKDVAMGEVRELTFPGSRGESVHAFVVLPPAPRAQQGAAPPAPPGTKNGPLPLVQVVHGGPHGVSGDAFGFRWNPHVFAAPGYVAMLVNFQGSTGWGQDFAQRIQGAWGERPFEDVMKGTDALLATGLVDEKRMALMGGSYGGYMAAWVAAHTDRFRCIVNHAGVYDTLSHWACDVTQGRHKAFGGQPWDGLEAIDRWNPARFTKGMVTPMFVIHGEKDYRVPVTQALQCYNVLKAKGVPARLLYYPDEGHWVLKPKNSLLWNREVAAWLARWLQVKVDTSDSLGRPRTVKV